MNFTELQVELRSIENQISRLHNEIEKMKPKTEEEKKTDFKKINILARRHTIMNRSMIGMERTIKLFFISSLSYLSLIEEEGMNIRLLYLTRLSFGSGLDINTEEIYKRGLEFKETFIDVTCESLASYKYTYLVEAFILANLSGDVSGELLTVISDIAKMMECDKEEIRVIAQVAKAKLLDDIDVLKELPVPSKNQWSNCFADYIPHDWIVKQRKKCKVLCTLKSMQVTDMFFVSSVTQYCPCKIKSCLSNGSIVKKGDLICNYTEKIEKTSQEKGEDLFWALPRNWWEYEDLYKEIENTILAPCDGILFCIAYMQLDEAEEQTDEFLALYVVFYFDDYGDFCNWYEGENKLPLIFDDAANK